MESAAGAGGSSSDCEGEDQDEPSSSNAQGDLCEGFDTLNLQDDPPEEKEDELALFRSQWQRELESSPIHQKPQQKPEVAEPLSDEERAKQLFLRGVEFERVGKLYEAIQDYKRAMQILPDVEIRLYESSELKSDTPEVESSSEEEEREEVAEASEDEDAVEGEDLLTRLRRRYARNGRVCEPQLPPKSAHLSWLPYEVIQLILRWVVSGDLDAAALERVSAVSRGLHVAARDPDLWRSLCVRTWGIECGSPRSLGWQSWRHMFISRPRVNLNGVYISKTSYLRHGENSFQDHFYRPWYHVDYYRYLRFFPEGLVLTWTTAEEPQACVSALRSRSPRAGAGVVAGHYRLVGDKVVIVVKKTREEKKPAPTSNTRFRSRRKETHETHEQVFHMELELRSVRGRRNWQLCWSRYAVSTRREQWTQFELTPGKFPPYAFSRVRAYTAETHSSLPNTHAYNYN